MRDPFAGYDQWKTASPYDDYPEICEACGVDASSCTCPECPECGDIGNLACANICHSPIVETAPHPNIEGRITYADGKDLTDPIGNPAWNCSAEIGGNSECIDTVYLDYAILNGKLYVQTAYDFDSNHTCSDVDYKVYDLTDSKINAGNVIANHCYSLMDLISPQFGDEQIDIVYETVWKEIDAIKAKVTEQVADPRAAWRLPRVQ